MRKFSLASLALALALAVTAKAAQDEKKKDPDPKKAPDPKKVEDPKKDPDPKDKKDPDPKKDEDKAKAEKEKKAKDLKESVTKAKLEYNGKALVFNDEVYTYLVGLGNTNNYVKRDFKVYAYVVPHVKSGIGTEAHMGQYSGYIGSQNGYAVFASTVTGSGIGLKAQLPVVYIPVSDGGVYGTPVLVTGNDTGNGFAYLGDGPGLYLVPLK